MTRAAFDTIEALEGRRMLATVSGNQIAVFEGADGPVRINISGRGTFDFIGATRSEQGTPRLNEIPMTIFDTGGRVLREILGGYGGRDGIAPIDDVIEPNPSPSASGADAIAADNRGRTYGVNRVGSGALSVLRYDFSDGGTSQFEDNITNKVLTVLNANVGPGVGIRQIDVTRVIGADFDPSTDDTVNQNLMYFALDVNVPFPDGDNVQRQIIPVMLTYDVSTKVVTYVPGNFGASPSVEDEIRVDDFTIISASRVAYFASSQLAGQDEALEGLFITDTQFVDRDQFLPIRIGPDVNGEPPDPITEIASLEYIPGSDYLVAVDQSDPAGGADDAQLLRIPITSGNGEVAGRGRVIGPVVDPDEDTQDIDIRLGENLNDLAWNPRLEQEFFEPGKRGLLLGVDTARNTIVGIDQRERFQTPDLYAIYGRNVSQDTSVSISRFTLQAAARGRSFDTRLFNGQMNPFGGGPGNVSSQMLPGGGDEPATLGLGGGTGGLYLGIRTLNRAGEPVRPIIGLDAADRAGTSLGIKLPNTVRPGVFVTGTMKDFLFAGTITGSVRMGGSVDTFYAGNVLTGDIYSGAENLNDNFYVDGDLRNLVVSGGIGSPDAGANQNFSPNTDFRVNGRIQQIKTGETWRGSLDILAKDSEQSIGSSIYELETVPDNRTQNSAGLAFEDRLVVGEVTNAIGRFALVNGVVRNDSFDTPQVLGSYRSSARRVGQQFTVRGSIDNSEFYGDNTDYYGVPLLAGQTIKVQLTDLTFGPDSALGTYVQVIDPDGRVYASDRSNQNEEDFLNQAFTVKADKPGLWRVQVSPIDATLGGERIYDLVVDKLGNMAVGGLVSGGNIFLRNLDLGVQARNGDIGALLAGDQLEAYPGAEQVGRVSRFTNAVNSNRGNIRSLEGASVSRFNPATNVYSNFPYFLAQRGSVGLIRANAAVDADAFVYFNAIGQNLLTGRPAPELTIGGDYQVVEARGDFSAVMSANGGIGVIRVGSFAQNIIDLPGYLQINADNSGKSELGLIDVVDDFGTFEYGGPALSVGNGGNIRYLRVGGVVYADRLFGLGSPTVRTASDDSVTIRDDSGTNVRITPVQTTLQTTTTPGGGTSSGGTGVPYDPFGGGFIPDPFGNSGVAIPGTIFNPFPDGTVTDDEIVGDVSVSAYPVRSGGLVIYNVLSTTGVNISTYGSRAGGGGRIADITTLRTGAVGAAVVDTGTSSDPSNPNAPVLDQSTIKPSDRTPLSLASGQTLDVILSGSGTINVFEIGATIGGGAGVAGGLTDTANYTRVINNTSGEIVNLVAASVGRLEAARLGVSAPVANVAIEGLQTIADSRFRGGLGGLYPFNQARNAIRVGNAIDIVSRGALGNIAASGSIQNVVANSGNKNDKSQWEGIIAPIYAGGDIRRIEIGEGLQTSGSGDVSFGGIYVDDYIGLITNENGNGDIRGDIFYGIYFEGIELGGGGSILDIDSVQGDTAASFVDVIAGTTVTGFQIGLERFRFATDLVDPPTNTRVLYGLGDISIEGNGGIINSRFSAGNMGKIEVGENGFGVFTSEFVSSGEGDMDGIEVGGLGIRGTRFGGGNSVGEIIATGDGKLRRLTEFNKSVRQSENKDGIDGRTGISANPANDLYLYLGATKKLNKIRGVTEDGVIEDSFLSAARRLEAVEAWEIRSRVANGTRPRDETYPMQINFADEIGNITAGRDMNGVRMIGGNVERISSGRDMLQVFAQTTGTVDEIVAGRNVLGTSQFNVINQGSIGVFQANGFMNGKLFAARGIEQFIVKGDLGSEDVNGGIRSGRNIDIFKVGGSLIRSASVNVAGRIAMLVIDGDVGEKASIRASSFGKQKIGGVVKGDILTT